MISMILTWTLVIGVSIWLYYKKKFSYFSSHKIKHMDPTIFFGNGFKMLMKKEHFTYAMDDLYKKFPNDRFVGTYDFAEPLLVVRDPELLKKITVKDFDHFGDHRSIAPDSDPFFPKSLFGMKGTKWRDMRSTLSPAFTASKLRSMLPFMQECCDDMVDYLITETKKNNGVVEIDGRDLLSRYTNDVIATCAFGFKINSIKDRNNEFHTMGDKFTNFDSGETVKFLLIMAFPFLKNYINASFISPSAVKYFSKIFLTTMKHREDNNIYRADMLQLLLAAKKGTLTHEQSNVNEKDAGFATAEESHVGKSSRKQAVEWTDDYIVAQALIFLFAGFDTVSTSLLFMMIELAFNPDVQKKLQQEIDDAFEANDGKMDYDKLNELKYMDMCFSETLRKWPPTGGTDRLCLTAYNMGPPSQNALDYIIPAGKAIQIPTYSIHMDENFHPNPEQFDPERFSDENKHNIKPFTYLPFGLGPRNCIGSRFAISEVKLLVFCLLRNFDVLPGDSIKVPLRLDPTTFNFRLDGGHGLKFKLRSK